MHVLNQPTLKKPQTKPSICQCFPVDKWKAHWIQIGSRVVKLRFQLKTRVHHASSAIGWAWQCSSWMSCLANFAILTTSRKWIRIGLLSLLAASTFLLLLCYQQLLPFCTPFCTVIQARGEVLVRPTNGSERDSKAFNTKYKAFNAEDAKGYRYHHTQYNHNWVLYWSF